MHDGSGEVISGGQEVEIGYRGPMWGLNLDRFSRPQIVETGYIPCCKPGIQVSEWVKKGSKRVKMCHFEGSEEGFGTPFLASGSYFAGVALLLVARDP